MTDIKAQFEKLKDEVQLLKKRPSNADLLVLYSTYKQAIEGDVKGSRPGMLDLVNRAKYDAWAKLKGTKAEDAMKNYVAKASALLEASK